MLLALALLLAFPRAEDPQASSACGVGRRGGGGGQVEEAFGGGRSSHKRLLQLQNFGNPSSSSSSRAAKLKAGAAALGTALRQNVLSFLMTAKARARAPAPAPAAVAVAAVPAPLPVPAPVYALPRAALPPGLPPIIVQTSTPVSINNPINIDAGATQTNTQQQSGGGRFGRGGAGNGGNGGGPRVVIVPVFIGR